jgi:hypothetical protein
MSAAGATAVLGEDAPATQGAMAGNGEGSLPSFPDTPVEPSPGDDLADFRFGQPRYRPRWTAAADFIILQRIGSVAYPLVETVPADQSPDTYPGAEALNAADLHQGFSGGPRLDLIHHGDQDADLEVVYFQIDGWDGYRGIGPTPDDWLVMKAPGGFVQTQDNKAEQFMAWGYTSRLYNAEVNARWEHWRRVTLLAGFRWVNLTEGLLGTMPPERTVPFWNTQTKNNLYGLQIGAEAKLLERGRFSIACIEKAGLFDNHAEETTTASIYRILFGESDATDHLAFVGEIGVQCKYQITPRLSLRAGYEALWLQGVALAPGQIAQTVTHHGGHLPQEISLQPLGVACGSGVLYHGATAGLGYSF